MVQKHLSTSIKLLNSGCLLSVQISLCDSVNKDICIANTFLNILIRVISHTKSDHDPQTLKVTQG